MTSSASAVAPKINPPPPPISNPPLVQPRVADKPLEQDMTPEQLKRMDQALSRVIVLHPKNSSYSPITLMAIEFADFFPEDCLLRGSWTVLDVTHPRDNDFCAFASDADWESHYDQKLSEFINSKLPPETPEKLKSNDSVDAFFTAIPIYKNGSPIPKIKIYKAKGLDFTVLYKPDHLSIGFTHGSFFHCKRKIQLLATGKTFATKLSQFKQARICQKYHYDFIEDPDSIHNFHLLDVLDKTRRGSLINHIANIAAVKSLYKEYSVESFVKKWIEHIIEHWDHEASIILEFINLLALHANNPHGVVFIAESFLKISQTRKIEGMEDFCSWLINYPTSASDILTFIRIFVIQRNETYRFGFSKPIDPKKPNHILIYPYSAIKVGDQTNYILLPPLQNSPVQLGHEFLNCLPRFFNFARLGVLTTLFKHLKIDLKYLADDGLGHILEDFRNFFNSDRAQKMQSWFGQYPKAKSILSRLPPMKAHATPPDSSEKNKQIVQERSKIQSAEKPAAKPELESISLPKEFKPDDEALKSFQECANVAEKHHLPLLKAALKKIQVLLHFDGKKETDLKELHENIQTILDQSQAIFNDKEIEKILGPLYYKDFLAQILPRLIEKILAQPTPDLFIQAHKLYMARENNTFSAEQEQTVVGVLIKAWKVLSAEPNSPLHNQGCDLFCHAHTKNLLGMKDVQAICYEGLSASSNPAYLRKAFTVLNQMNRDENCEDLPKRIIPLIQNTLQSDSIELYRALFKLLVNLYKKKHSSFKLLMKEVGPKMFPGLLIAIQKTIAQLKYNGDEELLFGMLWCVLKSHPDHTAFRAVFVNFDILLQKTQMKGKSYLKQLEHKGIIARELLELQSSIKDSCPLDWSDLSVRNCWQDLAMALNAVTLKQASTYDGCATNRFQQLGREILKFFKKEEESRKVSQIADEQLFEWPEAFDSVEHFLDYYNAHSEMPPAKCAQYLQALFQKGPLSPSQIMAVRAIFPNVLGFKDRSSARLIIASAIKNQIFTPEEAAKISIDFVRALLSSSSPSDTMEALNFCKDIFAIAERPMGAFHPILKLLIASSAYPKTVLELLAHLYFDPDHFNEPIELFELFFQRIQKNPELNYLLMIFWRLWNGYSEDGSADHPALVQKTRLFTEATSEILKRSQSPELLYWVHEIQDVSKAPLLKEIKQLCQKILQLGIDKRNERSVSLYLNRTRLMNNESNETFVKVFIPFINYALPCSAKVQFVEVAIKSGIENAINKGLPQQAIKAILRQLEIKSKEGCLTASMQASLKLLQDFAKPAKQEEKALSTPLEKLRKKFSKDQDAKSFENCVKLLETLTQSISSDLKPFFLEGLNLLEEGLKIANWDSPELAELMPKLRDILLKNKDWTPEEKLKLKNCFIALEALKKSKPQCNHKAFDEFRQGVNILPKEGSMVKKLIADYEALLTQKPEGSLEFWYNLMYLYDYVDDFRKVILCTKNILRLGCPVEKNGAYLCLARAYCKLGYFQKAMIYYEKAFRILPTDETACIYAHLCPYTVNWEKAIKLHGKLKESKNPFIKSAEFNNAMKMAELCSQGKFKEAISALKAKQPLSSREILLLGLLYEKINAYDEAIEIYKRLNVIFQDHPVFLNVIGDIYRKRGQTEEAIVGYKKVTTLPKESILDPADLISAYSKLGEIYCQAEKWYLSFWNFSQAFGRVTDFSQNEAFLSNPYYRFSILSFIQNLNRTIQTNLSEISSVKLFLYTLLKKLATIPEVANLHTALIDIQKLLEVVAKDVMHVNQKEYTKLIGNEFAKLARECQKQNEWQLEINCLLENLVPLDNPVELALNETSVGVCYLRLENWKAGTRNLKNALTDDPTGGSLKRLWEELDNIIFLWLLLPKASPDRVYLIDFFIQLQKTLQLDPAIAKKIAFCTNPPKKKKKKVGGSS